MTSTGDERGFGDAAGEMAGDTEVEPELEPDGPLDGPLHGPLHGDESEAPGTDADGADADDAPAPEGPDLERQLAERTADLQRLQAEFVNYKRRVDRDRDLIRQNAAFTVLTPIVEVLDTIDRARESARSMDSELDGGLKAVAEQLERAVSAAGLIRFGEAGEAFDPTLHEALSHIGTDPEVEVPTAKVVAKAGYRIGDRVVRAAQVLVVDPAEQ